jgi:hypothetical protein
MSQLSPNEVLVAEICEQLIYRQPDSSNIWELLATEIRLRDRDQWSRELQDGSYEYKRIRTVILIRKLYQRILRQKFPFPDAKYFGNRYLNII